MGKSASEIDQELEQTRSNAAEKIEQIEQQVTQSAESVKQSLDWRYQVEERPLMALGTAFLGGLILGEMTNGGKSDHAKHQHNGAPSYSYETNGSSDSGGIGGAVRQAARTSGADDAITSAVAAVLSTAGQRIKDTIEETYPGFLDRYERSKTATGGMSDRIKAATSEDGVGSATPAPA